MIKRSEIESAIRIDGQVTRRNFLAFSSAISLIPFSGVASLSKRRFSFQDNPFSLGVASGDPNEDGFVIWTRLAPKPLEPDGGMPRDAIQVQWMICEDDSMKQIVREGTAIATPQLGHSVHVEVEGLAPDRWYWYQFKAGDAISQIGRTRTMPLDSANPAACKFAVTSCQHFEQGLFTAYEQMMQEEVDLVFHLGDYIYEYAGKPKRVREHIGKEINSLADYRVRYSQYRSDPLLHGMHAKCPWFVTWDDHEFDNNCADDISEEPDVLAANFLQRRANAYQAYYEMMPLRKQSMPNGYDMRLYRKSNFGRLANFMVLDERQYRSDQPNGDRKSPINDAALDIKQTMLGRKQKNWLSKSLISSESTWNILAQQVMMAAVGFRKKENEQHAYSMDQWPGYMAERNELMRFLDSRRVPNPVVLTGDIHSNWANELRVDDLNPETTPVAVEFVATSLSSGGNGVEKAANHEQMLSDNEGVKFHNRERGYVLCSVTPKTWTTDYVVCDEVEKPGGKCFTRASFIVEAGKSKINPLA